MKLKIRTSGKRLLSQLLAAALTLQIAASFPAGAEERLPMLVPEAAEALYTQTMRYSDYYDAHAGEKRPDCSVTVRGQSYLSVESESGADISVGSITSEADNESRDNVLIWNAAGGTVTYALDVPETGCYCMELAYLPIPSNMAAISFSIAIDGEVPYDTASRAALNKVFVNDGALRYDSRGNQMRPSLKQTGMWITAPLRDADGLFNDPLMFYLEKGAHEIRFEMQRGYFALDYFRFYNPPTLPTYAEYRSGVDAAVTPEETPSALLRIEGEDAAFRSDPTLYLTSDNASYLASPADPAKTVYNTIGAGTWKQAMQTITWTIPEETLSADGWYKIGIKFRQNELRGFCSNRRFYIDGEVLCEEMEQVRFFYDNDWQVASLTDADGSELYVYLTGGQAHTLTMEVIPGEIGGSMRVLDAAVRDINEYYRKILMITGPAPDKYTDYYVHERIPGLLEEFTRLAEELKQIQGAIEALTGSKGSEAAALERMCVALESCVERPLRIPDYLKQIKDNITALSSWMVDYRVQPLEVDYIEIASPDREFSSVKENPFKALGFGWKRFYSSFFEDYTNLSDDDDQEAINVWVSLGRDQALVVKSLTDSEFAEQHDANISVNLVVGGIVEATLAGKGPDAALFLGGEFPVNLAARGLLVDLQEFPDYEEISARFHAQAFVPYQYDGGIYGLPLTQSWAMLFYRKDILAELGITQPPETWDELIDMLPALQRNYMYAGLVLPEVSGISAATESGHTFAALMLQNGLNYYNETQTQTTFNEVAAVKAFEKWTDFYTKYGFEQTYDAFSRFRTGEYPIVIADYDFYNQLSVASPEIKGLWDFTAIPGTVQEDGSISHAVNSIGSGAVIFEKCKDKQGAWEFIKWFTSAEVQAEYGTQMEGLLGQLGRYETANTEALGQLAWSGEEQKKLLAAKSELTEIPIIPASYAVTRNVMNAFRETINNHENPRDTLLWYNRDINTEIIRKRKNLGLPAEGET